MDNIIFVPGKFLSTLSLRRATGIIDIVNNVIDHFYPRSPCGERRRTKSITTEIGDFYPRSPCGERRIIDIVNNVIDHFYPRSPCGERQPGERHASSRQEFLSTLSLRRATGYGQYYIRAREISIHALLAESDIGDPVQPPVVKINFYPRSPCGERPIQTLILLMVRLFLSTLSLRRATGEGD